ncbi:hypothetical protein [Chlorogloeopsis sp. ULAP02]|uniref:hypothetical protein n=1 Tax=Chlorogloeopsis sp. ULAP02 TaxID=3107926 RepID=UPI00398B1B65
MKRTKNALFYLVLISVSSCLIACNRVRNNSSAPVPDTGNATNNSATTPSTRITPNPERTSSKFETIPDTVNIPSGYPIDPPVDLEFPNMPPIAPGSQNIPGVSPNTTGRAIAPGGAVPNQTSILPRMPTTPNQAYTTPNTQIIPRLPSSNINRASVPSRTVIPSQPSPPVLPNLPSQATRTVARTPVSSATTVPPVIPTTSSRAFTPPSSTIPSRQIYTTPKIPTARVQPKRTSTTAKSSPSQEVQYSQESISDANAVVRGLVVARREGKIKPHTRTWRQTQDAIILLRRGKTRQEAATRAKVPMSLLTQLIEWGQNQPNIGSVMNLQNSQPLSEQVR